ncbi:MAG: hypothetical protein IKL42_01305 [Clostridia bacterium]|nr:hypothetical protein [Clostridia bacterium]
MFGIDITTLLIFFLSALIIGIIIGIVIFFKSLISSIKTRNSTKLKYTLVCILCVIIAMAAWIFNFGWLRMILTFLAVPVIHTIVFMVITNFALLHIDKSSEIKTYVIISYVTYLLSYISLPDFADMGPTYVFFGLIHNDAFADISFYITFTAIAVNIVFLILQLVKCVEIKRENKEQTKEPPL